MRAEEAVERLLRHMRAEKANPKRPDDIARWLWWTVDTDNLHRTYSQSELYTHGTYPHLQRRSSWVIGRPSVEHTVAWQIGAAIYRETAQQKHPLKLADTGMHYDRASRWADAFAELLVRTLAGDESRRT